MKFSVALTAVILPALVNAQYGGPPAAAPSSSSSSSAAPATPSAPPSNSTNVNVDVGAGGQFVFNPANFNATNGTIVTFFFPAEANAHTHSGVTPHSVTQSSFANPCTYLAAANGSAGGFDSGLQNSKQFSINITNDQAPIWFHCKAPTHCGLGMVGSINAPSTGSNTASAFLAAAKAIGAKEVTENDNGPVTGGVNAVATATPAATVLPSGSGSSSGSSGSSSSGASRVVVNGLLALVAVAAGVSLA
ncbi:hypothetical protein BC834DRAFT_1001155 [Gloeopeniophorella convolvens]|nr:hypothetical protein BC834DRAFT_1001155 [Gloeopeniophorella convolvens]